MSLAERLTVRMAELGLSQSELARRANVSQPTIAHLAKGRAAGSTHLHRIARELGTTAEYLTGETDDPSAGAIPAPTSLVVAEQLSAVLIPELDIGYSMGGGVVIADHQDAKMIPFPRDWLRNLIRGSFDQVFVARGAGDSMQPTLLDGDVIVIDTAQAGIDRQDALWAVSYGDLGMVKRIRRLPDGGYQINSDNNAVSPITAYDGEMHVIGRVIWVGRRM